jgi:hypothetical protein
MLDSAPYHQGSSNDDCFNDDSSVTTNELPSPQKSERQAYRVVLKKKIINSGLKKEMLERHSPGSAANELLGNSNYRKIKYKTTLPIKELPDSQLTLHRSITASER